MALKRTVIFAVGKVRAEERALVLSGGSEVSICDVESGKGSGGEGDRSSGMEGVGGSAICL